MHKAYVEDIESSFIRDMRVLKEPAVIVARDRQLNDMVKFCTNEIQFGDVTTFCLGDFNVTMTTYRHLVLKCRRSSEPPVFIGPTMIHCNKTFSTYLFFASSLVGLRPELSINSNVLELMVKKLCLILSSKYALKLFICFVQFISEET